MLLYDATVCVIRGVCELIISWPFVLSSLECNEMPLTMTITPPYGTELMFVHTVSDITVCTIYIAFLQRSRLFIRNLIDLLVTHPCKSKSFSKRTLTETFYFSVLMRRINTLVSISCFWASQTWLIRCLFHDLWIRSWVCLVAVHSQCR